MNKDAHTKPSNAIALLYAPGGSALERMTDGLSCREFTAVVTDSLEKFKSLATEEGYNICACVIDSAAAGDQLDMLLQTVPASLRGSNGPIIVFKPENDPYVVHSELVSKIISEEEGQRALRLIIAVEIEEFRRFTALREELKKRSSAIGLIVSGKFQLKTRREAQNLATMLSLTCPEPIPIAIGLAELLINGIEHGCLRIGHAEKGQLIEEGRLDETMKERRKLPEYANAVVTLKYWRDDQQIHFEIHDEGDGFDYQSFVGDSEGHSKKHGRGILMAKGCFDTLEYRGRGNDVYAAYTLQKPT